MRETPAQRYREVRNGTSWDGDRATHNPKVVGSNPTPATIENSRSEALSGEPGRAFLASQGPFFYRVF